MADIPVGPNDSVSGTTSSDTFIVDPDTLVSATITDPGGSSDTLLIYDRPGRTAGEFLVSGGYLIWKNYQLDAVRIQLNSDGTSPVEFFEWQRLPEDGNPYTVINRIILPGQAYTAAHTTVAGTALGDKITAPHLVDFEAADSEIYGNQGNDTLTASDSFYTHIYAGRGNDVISGKGAVQDDFSGDAGNDRLTGLGGNDWLDGGAGKDHIFGGAGKDQITGGSGDDTMTGGLGADQFLYTRGQAGSDVVTDYQVGVDSLDFHGLKRAGLHLDQVGADVVITMANGATITVDNAAVADLTLTFS